MYQKTNIRINSFLLIWHDTALKPLRNKSYRDTDAIASLKAGDPVAFTAIYEHYSERLTGFASSKLFNLNDTRDIIHDIFVKLWEDRVNLRIERNLEAYLFAMVRHRVIDKIRKNISHERYAEMLSTLEVSQHPDVEQKIAVDELDKKFRKSVDELSPRVKEIFLLSRNEELSIQEIALKLNLSEQTVKNQITYALKHLRNALTTFSITMLLL
jgi:RNA polymerase sigma-70 factor (family 1)